jgi:preprotein translocase subunit SecG
VDIAYVALIVLYVFICFFLILVVLVQQGKGADIAGAFGGGGTQTAFGARGATTLLHKLTTGAFVGFILLSLVLTLFQARQRPSVVKGVPQKIDTQGVFPKPDAAGQPPAAGQGPPGQPAPAAPAAQAPANAAPQPAPAVPAQKAPAPKK